VLNSVNGGIHGATSMTGPTSVYGPGGADTAFQYLSTGGTVPSRVQFKSSIAANATQYTATVYVKGVNNNTVTFGFGSPGFTGNSRRQFYLDTLTTQGIGGSAAAVSIEDAGNGWRRLRITTTATTSATGITAYLDLGTRDIETHTTDQGFQVYGFQIEAGMEHTSYIPTYGSTATRAADTSTSALGVDSWYSQAEGTVFAKSSYFGLSSASTGRIYDINDGTTLNRHHLIIRGANNDLRVQTRKDSVDGFSESFSMPAANNLFSNALGYKLNDCASSLDGGNTVNDNTVLIPTVDRMFIGARDLSSAYLNGHISRLAYFPTRLPDDKLKSITT